ncbi:MAG: malonyl CoA-acyl carrier protein transacylase, partial [Nitriliruptoraceae bacterium]
LAAAEVRDAAVPIVAGATAREATEAAAVTAALVDGMLAPVRWRQVQERLAELGATTVVEVGPGGVLAGLAKRTVPEVAVHTVATPEDLDGVLEALAVAAAGR